MSIAYAGIYGIMTGVALRYWFPAPLLFLAAAFLCFAAAVAAAAVQKAASPAKPAAEPESALGSALGAAAETKPAETKSVKTTKPVKAVKPAAAASDDDAAGLLGELGALLGYKDD